MSNQRPNSCIEFRHVLQSRKRTINIDEEGICDACRAAERKKNGIDWKIREEELKELCKAHKRDDGHYDCLIPGSGGKDSFYASWMLKYKYGMHPLTVTWAPSLYTDWGRRNHSRWIQAGFDNILVTPNAKTHRLLTRLAVDNLLHPFQPFILGQKQLAPRMAKLFNIPLIFYGENEAEYGNPLADNEEAKRSWEYYASSKESDIYLGGASLEALTSQSGYGRHKADLNMYLPMDPNEAKNINVHYLGYYLKWHPQGCYFHACENGGFECSPERTPGTYSKYNSIDDKIDDFHYYTTFIKYGIGRATYDASQEIRSGDITRDEALSLVRQYDGEFPERFAEDIFKYLTITPEEFPVAWFMFEHPKMNREYFDSLCDKFRSSHLWDNRSLKHKVWECAAP